jgi:hypothetical protein
MLLNTNTEHRRSPWETCFKALARFSRGRIGRWNDDRHPGSTRATRLGEWLHDNSRLLLQQSKNVRALRRTTDVPLSTTHRLGGAQGARLQALRALKARNNHEANQGSDQSCPRGEDRVD